MTDDFVVDFSRSPHARLRPVSLPSVTLTDTFWSPRLQINHAQTIPSQYRQCLETGRIENFRRAAGKSDKPFEGIYFNDSDVYKWLEAASFALATHPDDIHLRKMVDETIDEIAAAQDENGYLNTYFSVDKVGERWTNLRDMHELYCAGHLFQAAVAHFRATGETSLLDVAVKFADHICDTFGANGRDGTCGHEEIEMGLAELFRATGNRRYLEQAKLFIDRRGQTPSALLTAASDNTARSEYHQDAVPYRDLTHVVGHAVRMLYLAAGAADVYAETGEAALKAASDRQWDNMTTRRMYVTGGLGARYEGEAFGKDYELPSDRAYTETCAAIGSVMWNWRLLHVTGDAKYADLLEHTLYNAVLPGLSLDGRQYFYQNPLTDDGTHRRQAWFGCACCPPNVARLLASLPSYFYSTDHDGGIHVHLYAAGQATIGGVKLTQTTNYPWDGDVTLTLNDVPETAFALNLRIPAWAEGAIVQINDETPTSADAGAYFTLSRVWNPGDRVRLSLPMPVRSLISHPLAADPDGRVALLRGPLVYCLEAADNADFDVRAAVLPAEAHFADTVQPDLLGGIVTLQTAARAEEVAALPLYRDAAAPPPASRPVMLTAIPYFAWANREAGAMTVWMRTE